VCTSRGKRKPGAGLTSPHAPGKKGRRACLRMCSQRITRWRAIVKGKDFLRSGQRVNNEPGNGARTICIGSEAKTPGNSRAADTRQLRESQRHKSRRPQRRQIGEKRNLGSRKGGGGFFFPPADAENTGKGQEVEGWKGCGGSFAERLRQRQADGALSPATPNPTRTSKAEAKGRRRETFQGVPERQSKPAKAIRRG
jgi:hypothetical protein